MEIKVRVLLLAILLGGVMTAFMVLFNQLLLKKSLQTLQKQQVTSSFHVGKHSLRYHLDKIENLVKNLSNFASELVVYKSRLTEDEIIKIIKKRLFRALS